MIIDSVSKLVDFAISGDNVQAKFKAGIVKPLMAKNIKELTGLDVSGYSFLSSKK